MKAKTRRKVAKTFALFVVLVMMVQVLLPLFETMAQPGNPVTDGNGSEVSVNVEPAAADVLAVEP